MNPTNPIILYYLFSCAVKTTPSAAQCNLSNLQSYSLLAFNTSNTAQSSVDNQVSQAGEKVMGWLDLAQPSLFGTWLFQCEINWDYPENYCTIKTCSTSPSHCKRERGGVSQSLIKVWKDVKHTSLPCKQFFLTFLKTSMLTSRQKLGFLDLTLKAFGRLYRTICLHRQSFHLSLKLNKLSSISMMIGSFHSFQNRFSFWFQLVICPSQDCFYLRMIDSCYLVGLFVQNGSLSRLRGVYVNIWPIHPFH